MLAPYGSLKDHPEKFFVPHHFTDARGRFFSMRIISILNSFPEHVVMAGNLGKFKIGLAYAIGLLLLEFL